jgi:glycosyltransferase involved in cell wall biosynthesis
MGDRFSQFGVSTEVLHLGGQVAIWDAVRLARRLQALSPDALLISSFTKSWLAALGGRLARVPRVVARLALEDYRPGRRVTYRWAFRSGVDRVVTNSRTMREAVLADLPGIDPERVLTLYNGVRLQPRRAADGAVRSELGLGDRQHLLLTMARLEPQKELHRVVRLAHDLGPDVHVAMAGVGEGESELRELARDLGIGGRVHLLGYREDTTDLLAAADLYVVSSRSEGMSNAMLEAMAAGVPVLSTPVSGASEALEAAPGDCAPGVIVDWEGATPVEITRALLDDVERRARMGAAGQARVRETFDWERAMDAWERVLVP